MSACNHNYFTRCVDPTGKTLYYRCSQYGELFMLTIEPLKIGVSFGAPPAEEGGA